MCKRFVSAPELLAGFTPLHQKKPSIFNMIHPLELGVTGFSLIEMIVVLTVVSFIMLSFTAMSSFFMRQVNISKERTNMWSQLDYTISDMRTRCVSAISTTTPLASGGNITLDASAGNFSFVGESDIFNITPDNTTDNANYTYRMLPATDPDNPSSLVLETTKSGTTTKEVLIDGEYNPTLKFQHHCNTIAGVTTCDEPNFITVTLDLRSSYESLTASRTEGIRFWFLDVVQ